VGESFRSNGVNRLGGQLRVESKVNEGSRFSFLIPLALSEDGGELIMTSPAGSSKNSTSSMKSLQVRSRKQSLESSTGDIDSLVEALSSDHMAAPSPPGSYHRRTRSSSPNELPRGQSMIPGVFGVSDSSTPLRPVKVDGFGLDTPAIPPNGEDLKKSPFGLEESPSISELLPPLPTPAVECPPELNTDSSKLRVLIVEVTNPNLNPTPILIVGYRTIISTVQCSRNDYGSMAMMW
jgi:hypothetical protein